MQTELAIIGAGNMAEAIVRGILSAGLLKPEQLVASDISEARRALFASLGVRAVSDNAEAVRGARRVLLSVKPQMMKPALEQMSANVPPDALIISIAAGISAAFIARSLGRGIDWRVIRTMPNTPMLVGQGMVGLARGTSATTTADVADARKLFETAASVVEVPEEQLHAVTAVSGSGPAYFFFLVEQMVKAGIELGLTPAQAHELACKTALGAATMLTQSPDAPEELRRKVTSPNGTTHAAIVHMQSQKVPEAIVEAVKAADRRSRELGV